MRPVFKDVPFWSSRGLSFVLKIAALALVVVLAVHLLFSFV